MLLEESGQARQMLRRLLRGRLVFTPEPETQSVRVTGEGDVSGVFEGLFNSQALASPPGFEETYFEVPLAGDNRRAA